MLWKFRERKDGFFLMGVWENLTEQIPLPRMPRVWRKMEEGSYKGVEVGKSVHKQASDTGKTS